MQAQMMAKKTNQDPTGQRVNRSRSIRRVAGRLEKARHEVLALSKRLSARRVGRFRINRTEVIYEYTVSPDDWEILGLSIRGILDRSLETVAETKPFDWWFDPDIELPFRQGSLEELVEVNQLISTAAIPTAGAVAAVQISPQQILFSQKYLQGLRNAQIRNYGLIKTLSRDTAAAVLFQIQQGVDAGISPRKITQAITRRFDVAKSNSKRIVNTEVNRAYNDARLSTVTLAGEMTGLDLAVTHISALIPTTRDNHAARHNNVYTVEQQQRWWNSGVERINCLCSTRTVVVGDDGGIIQTGIKRKIKDKRG